MTAHSRKDKVFSKYFWIFQHKLRMQAACTRNAVFLPHVSEKIIPESAWRPNVAFGKNLSRKTVTSKPSAYSPVGFTAVTQVTRPLGLHRLRLKKAQLPTSQKSVVSRLMHRSKRLKDLFLRSLLYRFLLNFWGTEVTFCLYRNLQKTLSVAELAFVKVQQHRIFSLAPARLHTPKQRERYPWANGFLAIYLAVRYRDPALMLNWLQTRVRVMSMFAHLRFFRILGLVLKNTTTVSFGKHRLKGFSFYLVGKISVTGNAMSRAYRSFAGNRSNSNLTLRLATGFNIIRTSTGCLGFTLSFFF